MKVFSIIVPLLRAYRRTKWKSVTILFILVLLSVQAPQLQSSKVDVEEFQRFSNYPIFDLYITYFPIFSYEDTTVTEIIGLKDKLETLDKNVNLTSMFFSNQVLEFGPGRPVLLLFSSELEDEVIASSNLNFSISDQMLTDLNLTGYSIRYANSLIMLKISQQFYKGSYEFTVSHFRSTFTKNGLNYSSTNFMILPWKNMDMLKYLPVIGNISFAWFNSRWIGKMPDANRFIKKVKNITNKASREVQLFAAESKSSEVVFLPHLEKALANYESQLLWNVGDSLRLYFLNTVMLLGLLVLAIREQRRNLRGTIEMLNFRGYDRKRSSMFLLLIFMTNIASVDILFILFYWSIRFLEIRLDRLIIGMNIYVFWILTALIALMTVVAAICWGVSEKISIPRIITMETKKRTSPKSFLLDRFETISSKFLVLIFLIIDFLPIIVPWTVPLSSINNILQILMLANSFFIAGFYRKIPTIKKQRIQAVGMIVKKPVNLAPYRNWVLFALIFLTIVSLTQSPKNEDDLYTPGDLVVSPIPSNPPFSAIENLSNMEDINLAVPFSSETIYSGFDFTSGMIIDFKAFSRLILGSQNFVLRTYQPLGTKELFNQIKENEVIVTGPLAVKWNLQVGDTIKLEFATDDFSRFEVEIKIKGIVSGIYVGYMFSEAIFVPKNLYMEITGSNEQNMSASGFFLDLEDDIQSEELASLINTIERELGTKFPSSTIQLSRSIDPQRKIMRENDWGFDSHYYLIELQDKIKYWMNHCWVFLVVFPVGTVLLNIIHPDILEILHQRGLNKGKFLEQYRKTEIIGVLLSAMSFGAMYYSWRTFWFLRKLTSYPSIPWLFEKELVKAVGWSIGYAIMGGIIIYYKFKRYDASIKLNYIQFQKAHNL